MSRETKTGGVPGGVSTALAMGIQNVPIIVWRCVEEVERRGLDIIGNCRMNNRKYLKVESVREHHKNRRFISFNRSVQTLRFGDQEEDT